MTNIQTMYTAPILSPKLLKAPDMIALADRIY
jgi:hypothetical protein